MAITDQQHGLSHTPGPSSAQADRPARRAGPRPLPPAAEWPGPDLEELWRIAFEANPTMYFIVDEAGAIVSVNRFGAQQLGYEVGELVGRRMLDVFCEPDRAFVQQNADSCFAHPGHTLRWEARKMRKDGEMLHVRETANAVMLKNRPVLLVACEDVTERRRAEEALRESEERFRTLVQFSFDVYWETDPQHRFVRQVFNRELGEALGMRSEIGMTRWEVPYLEPDEDAWRRHRETLDAHLPFRDFELARPTPDGGKRYISVSGLPAFDEAGVFVGYRGVGRNITERKTAEVQRAWFLENLDRIQRAMHGTSDLERVLSDVLAEVLAVFGGDRAWLGYPCDPQASTWRTVMEHTSMQAPAASRLGTNVAMTEEVAAAFRAALAVEGAVLRDPDMVMAVRPKVDSAWIFALRRPPQASPWSGAQRRLFEQIGRRLEDTLTSLLIFRRQRESERKLEEAQRIGHMGYFEYDLRERQLTFSDETCRIFGFEPQDLPLWQGRILDLVHPDDRARLSEAVEAAWKGKGRFDVEYRIVRPDGELRIVHSRGETTRHAHEGAPRAFGTLHDITEQRRAQQLTRHVFETAPDGMVIIGRDYRYQRVNPVYESNWNMPAERIVGLHVRDLFGDEVFEDILKPRLDRCFAGEQVSFADWFSNARGRFYYSVIYAPLRLGSEQVEAALAITRDLTEHMHASEALRDAEAALARVNRVTTLGVLAASIAHEVNQPLGAMITSAAAGTRWLAAQPPEMEKARSALQRIVADGRRAGQVVDRIRALVNRQAPRRDRVDVNEAILEVIALTRDEMRRKAIALHTSLAPDLPAIEGDRVQLQQVVLNLLVNAIEAMDGSGTSVRELAVTTARDGANTVAVEVRDSGPGVAPEHAERLFEAFYTTKDEGIGMGLSISRSIVEAHGGRLSVTANVPRGATFRFSLPLRQPLV